MAFSPLTDSPAPSAPTRRYRSIWISDVHLGTRACQADALLDFLEHTESDTLYLVGDIVDGWRLKKVWYWPQAHNDVVQKILTKARKGTKVIYIPGNHDESFRPYIGQEFGSILLLQDTIHVTADGKRFLVTHGDQFDAVVNYAKWLAFVGDYAYRAAIVVNKGFNLFRRLFGLSYWSLSAYLKYKVKNAVGMLGAYEKMICDETRQQGAVGVICGHIHRPVIRDIDGITYCNDGDWVESCTALVEDEAGQLRLINWLQERASAAVKEVA